MENLIIIGLSKTARHAYEFIKSHGLFNVLGFAVNEEYRNTDSFIGLPVYSIENLRKEVPTSDFKVFIALLWNHLNADRKRIYTQCKSLGYEMANLISPLSMIRGDINGDNCWIHDYVVIQNNAVLESDIMVMAFTLIGANTHIGSHCFFGARSLLGGGSTVGEQSFIGLSSTIFDDTTIGKKCIVGACTAVKRNMPDFTRCKTASDAVDFKQYSEDEIENKLVFSKNVRALPCEWGGGKALIYNKLHDNQKAA